MCLHRSSDNVSSVGVNLGWDDIGYNYVVGSDGRVYEGRGWGYEGGHTYGHNRDAVAICAIGNFQKKRPNRKMLQAIANLIDCALKQVCYL